MKSRSTIVMLLAAVLAVAGAAVMLSNPTAARAGVFNAAVEDEGAGCPVTLPGSTASNAKLPDPFTRIDGSRITTTDDWRCRREEIKKLAERSVYGTKPGKPATVTGTVSRTNIT